MGFGLGTNDWGLQEPSVQPHGGSMFESWNWGQPLVSAPVAPSGPAPRGPPGLPKATNTPPPGLGTKQGPVSAENGPRSGFLSYLDEKRS